MAVFSSELMMFESNKRIAAKYLLSTFVAVKSTGEIQL